MQSSTLGTKLQPDLDDQPPIPREAMPAYSPRDEYAAYSEWRSDIAPSAELNMSENLATERLLNFDMDLLGENYPLEVSDGSMYASDAANGEIPRRLGRTLDSAYNVLSVSKKVNDIFEENNSFLGYSTNKKSLESFEDSDVAVRKPDLNFAGANYAAADSLSNADDKAEIKLEKNIVPSSNRRASASTLIHKKYAINAFKTAKRKKFNSISLPQSPDRAPLETEASDAPVSLCFEDLNEVDFDQLVDDDINIPPERAFNRSFDIADVLNDMNKFDFINKDIISAGDLFSEEAKDASLPAGIDFDLTNFIDTKIKVEDDFLLDCFNPTDVKYLCDFPNHTSDTMTDDKEADAGEKDSENTVTNNVSSTKCGNQTIKKKVKTETKTIKSQNSNNAKAKNRGAHFLPKEAIKIENTADSEDYIDVESVSDSESFPIISANSVNALFQQFEAAEEISNTLNSKKSVLKKGGKSNWMVNDDISANNSNCNSKKEMKTIHPTSNPDFQSKTISTVSSSSNINLDHDYCHASQLKVDINSLKLISDPLSPSPQLNNTFLVNNGLLKHLPISQSFESKCNSKTSILKVFSSNNLKENNDKVGQCSKMTVNNNKLQNKSFAFKNCDKKSKTIMKDDKNIQNIVFLDNGVEKLININNGDTNNLIRNNNAHKNSLLLCNFVKKSKLPPKKETINSNFKNNPKQSLLKPIVKDNIKMVSLLKTNYANNNFIQKKPPDIVVEKSVFHQNTEKTPEDKTECSTITTSPIGKQKLIIVNKSDCKKRLNLNEYKKRRDGDSLPSINSNACSSINNTTSKVDLANSSQSFNNNLKSNALKKCISMETEKTSNTSIQNSNQKLFDPIAEAAKKALRLKKTGIQDDKIDKIVMSKIPKVNNVLILPMVTENGKLLPMIKTIGEKEDVVNEIQPRKIKRKNSLYDEIEMVSIGVNTNENCDPPSQILNENNNTLKLDKHKSKLSDSIGLPDLSDCIVDNKENSSEVEHGEDRIILHKMKNCEKPITHSIGTQTESIQCSLSENKDQNNHNQKCSNSNYCQIDDCNKVNYSELINRWKTDPIKKSSNNHLDESVNIVKTTTDCTNGTASSVSSRSSRHRSRNAKYKYRRRDDSSSSHSSNSFKKEASYSRDQMRNRSYDDSHRAVKLTNLPPLQSNGYFSDDRSVKSLPSKSKRKRNSSISSNEFPFEVNDKKSFNQRRNKIYKEDKKSYKQQRSVSISSDSSSDSICSSVSNRSYLSVNSYSTSNSSSRSFHTRSSSKRSEKSNQKRNVRSSNGRKSRDDSYEERKIVYVGMLEPDISVAELKVKFIKYGQINEVKIHTKDDGMRYGFITFAEARQSYTVLDKASSDADISHYDVFFGGRRTFCKQVYADLDDLEAMQEESEYYPTLISRTLAATKPLNSFDNLLQQAKAVLNARKTNDRKLVYADITQ